MYVCAFINELIPRKLMWGLSFHQFLENPPHNLFCILRKAFFPVFFFPTKSLWRISRYNKVYYGPKEIIKSSSKRLTVFFAVKVDYIKNFLVLMFAK